MDLTNDLKIYVVTAKHNPPQFAIPWNASNFLFSKNLSKIIISVFVYIQKIYDVTTTHGPLKIYVVTSLINPIKNGGQHSSSTHDTLCFWLQFIRYGSSREAPIKFFLGPGTYRPFWALGPSISINHVDRFLGILYPLFRGLLLNT